MTIFLWRSYYYMQVRTNNIWSSLGVMRLEITSWIEDIVKIVLGLFLVGHHDMLIFSSVLIFAALPNPSNGLTPFFAKFFISQHLLHDGLRLNLKFIVPYFYLCTGDLVVLNKTTIFPCYAHILSKELDEGPIVEEKQDSLENHPWRQLLGPPCLDLLPSVTELQLHQTTIKRRSCECCGGVFSIRRLLRTKKEHMMIIISELIAFSLSFINVAIA